MLITRLKQTYNTQNINVHNTTSKSFKWTTRLRTQFRLNNLQVYMGEDVLQNKDWIYINSTFIHVWTGTYFFYQLRWRKICQLRRYKKTQRNCSIEIIEKIEEQNTTNWSYTCMEKQNATITWTELNCISCMQCTKFWSNKKSRINNP
jgi:hypothetical protein